LWHKVQQRRVGRVKTIGNTSDPGVDKGVDKIEVVVSSLGERV
jgi:hypothetical protein